jgi:hypothetical protein
MRRLTRLNLSYNGLQSLTFPDASDTARSHSGLQYLDIKGNALPSIAELYHLAAWFPYLRDVGVCGRGHGAGAPQEPRVNPFVRSHPGGPEGVRQVVFCMLPSIACVDGRDVDGREMEEGTFDAFVVEHDLEPDVATSRSHPEYDIPSLKQETLDSGRATASSGQLQEQLSQLTALVSQALSAKLFVSPSLSAPRPPSPIHASPGANPPLPPGAEESEDAEEVAPPSNATSRPPSSMSSKQQILTPASSLESLVVPTRIPKRSMRTGATDRTALVWQGVPFSASTSSAKGRPVAHATQPQLDPTLSPAQQVRALWKEVMDVRLERDALKDLATTQAGELAQLRAQSLQVGEEMEGMRERLALLPGLQERLAHQEQATRDQEAQLDAANAQVVVLQRQVQEQQLLVKAEQARGKDVHAALAAEQGHSAIRHARVQELETSLAHVHSQLTLVQQERDNITTAHASLKAENAQVVIRADQLQE